MTKVDDSGVIEFLCFDIRSTVVFSYHMINAMNTMVYGGISGPVVTPLIETQSLFNL